ncbi:5'-nucleotidase [Oceanispirochaeta crateris]|uniref:5'-nucleotidase n=1 Tax=Oceanispirochaeta crateris TaxID=2518645 RepID=A0A5C1QLK0_9SPIO|nr:HAD-IG family 5'-nucleotidase [Oceanispirochaeta crateris]QEN07032.1 5'-nucleotidase [Oceanispirochaeta crateris]
MPVFINRVLNMKNIKVIGFDMDYTLIRYHAEAFEELTHKLAAKRLSERVDYPEEVKNLVFDFQRAIVGLVIDKRNGNLLQISRHGKVKIAYHGLEPLDFHKQQIIYQEMAIDLRDPDFQSLDTSFAISYGVLFSQLVQMKSEGYSLPGYREIAEDVNHEIDILHQDDSIKSRLRADFDRYVIKDPKVAGMLERYRDYGKKLMIITNSDYSYTRQLMDYALNPYLKKHKTWQDLFDIVITFADKPRFFEQKGRFLRIDPETELMSNHTEPVDFGIYQGGNFHKLQKDLGYSGSEILYLGDHIYGDVVSIKKTCNWRTALVLGDLEDEISGLIKSKDVQQQINKLMDEKLALEKEINFIDAKRFEGENIPRSRLTPLFDKMDGLNSKISELLRQYKIFFNPYWGEILRAGFDESRYAEQVEKYACIYMTKVSDLYDYSPKTYFRPYRRIMPHEDMTLLS